MVSQKDNLTGHGDVMKLSDDETLYYHMLRIRMVEEAIAREYPKGEMRTPVHLSIGQEAVAVGVCMALSPYDYVQSNHRCHGHYLANRGCLKAMIAELFGKQSGCSKGRGGSMHLIDTSHGNLGSSAIVGGGISIAVGLALGSAMRGERRVAVTFFGDGAVDEGTLYESIRFAQLRKLPVLFVYENNRLAVNSSVGSRSPGTPSFPGILRYHVDGTDVKDVFASTIGSIEYASKGYGPTFLECDCDRWAEHVGPKITEKGRCPLEAMRLRGFKEPDWFRVVIAKEIKQAFEFARESEEPKKEDLERYVYKDT